METIEILMQFTFNGIEYNARLVILSNEGIIQNAKLIQIHHKEGGEEDEPSEV